MSGRGALRVGLAVGTALCFFLSETSSVLVFVVERRRVAQRHGARRRVGVRRGAQRVRARGAARAGRVRRGARVVARRGARRGARRARAVAARRGGRVAHRAVPHPVLRRLLPVGRLRVHGQLHLAVARRRRRQEVGLARRRGEGRHVGRLRGRRVGRVHVGGAGRVRGRVEGGRVRRGRVVERGGERGVRGAGGGALGGRAGGRRVPEVLLEPLEQAAQRVEHALPELVPVGRHRDVLVRAACARQIRQEKPPGVVLSGGYDVVNLVRVLRLFLLQDLLGLIPHAAEGLVVFVGYEVPRVTRHGSDVSRDNFVQVFELRTLYP